MRHACRFDTIWPPAEVPLGANTSAPPSLGALVGVADAAANDTGQRTVFARAVSRGQSCAHALDRTQTRSARLGIQGHDRTTERCQMRRVRRQCQCPAECEGSQKAQRAAPMFWQRRRARRQRHDTPRTAVLQAFMVKALTPRQVFRTLRRWPARRGPQAKSQRLDVEFAQCADP